MTFSAAPVVVIALVVGVVVLGVLAMLPVAHRFAALRRLADLADRWNRSATRPSHGPHELDDDSPDQLGD